MIGKAALPEVRLNPDMLVGHHFQVVFLAGGVLPNPLDIRFQSVSGLSVTVATEAAEQGGENIFAQQLPGKLEYATLVLKRGVVLGSILAAELNVTMSTFTFMPSNVLVCALDADGLPLTSWLFYRAFPVKWEISDLDATSEEVLVETIELAYARMQSLRI